MERITLSIPSLFADHHVLRLRKALQGLPGVENVLASSMFRDVTVDFEPDKVNAAQIEKAVVDAGYPIGVEPHLSDFIESKDDGSPWYTIQTRITTTNKLDRELSGDFRKY